jgi:eukaryotic-like serine/threonine-protein kinase
VAAARRSGSEAARADVAEPGAAPVGEDTVSAERVATGPVRPAEPATVGTPYTRRRRSRGTLAGLLIAGVGIVVALIVWAANGLFDGSAHRHAREAGPAHGRSTPRPSATASSSRAAAPPASPPGGSPTASPSASPTTTALPSGYHWHHDRTGFSIAVPNGWSATHHGHYLYVEDPRSSRILIVDQSDTPKSDPLADWKEQEAARRGGFSGYHRIRLESVHYPQARKAADWEFSYNGSSGRTHVLNRNILANKKHAYALYWQVPDSRWKSSRSIFDVFASSFRPATD